MRGTTESALPFLPASTVSSSVQFLVSWSAYAGFPEVLDDFADLFFGAHAIVLYRLSADPKLCGQLR